MLLSWIKTMIFKKLSVNLFIACIVCRLSGANAGELTAICRKKILKKKLQTDKWHFYKNTKTKAGQVILHGSSSFYSRLPTEAFTNYNLKIFRTNFCHFLKNVCEMIKWFKINASRFSNKSKQYNQLQNFGYFPRSPFITNNSHCDGRNSYIINLPSRHPLIMVWKLLTVKIESPDNKNWNTKQ